VSSPRDSVADAHPVVDVFGDGNKSSRLPAQDSTTSASGGAGFAVGGKAGIMRRPVVLLVVALAAAMLLTVSPAAFANAVIHRVSVGSADILPPPGSDANFSLSAVQRADGTATGQWEDTVFGRSVPAVALHVDIDCLVVVGNDAWVSGVITRPDALAGLPAVTRVRDNGTSANDPADQVSFTFINIGVDCAAQPDLPLNDLLNGQVTVR
jgi:hypothetical protein